MSDLRINELPPAPGAIDATDEVVCTSANGTVGQTYRRPVDELADLFTPATPPGGSGLGTGGWELHQSWTQSVDGNLTGPWNILNLANCSDVRILGVGIVRSSSVAFTVEFSQDNGSTWLTTSTDYATFSTGAPSNSVGLPIHPAATAARTFSTKIEGLEAYPAIYTPNSSQGQPLGMFVLNGNPVNAMRLQFGAASLTAGHLKVYKKRLPRYRIPEYTLAAANALVGLQDGDTVIITDASSPVKGSVVTDGGSTRTIAFRDGSDWIAA